MKCRNKSALVLSLLAVMTISGTTACSIFPNSSEQPSGSENSSTESVVTATLTLDKTSLQLDLYTSATITASLENSEEVIVWSSSDESVAKVVDGVVTAYKAGTATITATAGDLEAMCTVTIGEPTELPEFTELPEELTLIKGTTEELDAVMMYWNTKQTTLWDVKKNTKLRSFEMTDYYSISDMSVFRGSSVEILRFFGCNGCSIKDAR